MQKQNQEAKPSRSRRSVRKKESTDIVDVILEDHKPLKKLIKIMKDSDKEFSERKDAFLEFYPLLIAHAKPEEQVLYHFMKGDEDLREEGFEGDVEHVLAEQLVEECKRTDDEDLAGAQIKVLAELVEHHIEEEEEEMLPSFKRNSKAEERALLGDEFLELKVEYLAADDDNIIPDPRAKKEEMRH